MRMNPDNLVHCFICGIDYEAISLKYGGCPKCEELREWADEDELGYYPRTPPSDSGKSHLNAKEGH